MSQFRCEIAVPSGLRRSRALARLEQHEPDALVLLPAHGLSDATHQVLDAAGHPLVTFLTERDPGVATDLIRVGFWELPETLALLTAVRPGARIIDAGAQVGYYAVLLARAAGRGGRVYAFEPDPDNARALAANAGLTAQLAPAAAPVEPLAFALTDRPGNARLHRSDRNPGDHSLVGWPDAIDSRVVPATTLDAARWESGDGPRVDGPVNLIKADVPGGEFALLRGAERTLAEDRPLVAATVRPAAAGPDAAPALVEWLVARGYGVFRLLPPAVGDPHQLACDTARVLDAGGAAELLRRRPPAPQFTLLAYPDGIRPTPPVG